MALLDFLGRDVGGYSATGANELGATYTPQTGVTYGDLVKAALQYGSKPGSSGPSLAQNIPTAPNVNTIALTQNAQLAQQQRQRKQGDSLGAIANWLLGGFGGGATGA